MQANRDNREWMDHARKTHAEAATAMRNLIDANFGWRVFPRRRPGTQRSAIVPETTGRAVAQGPASSQSPDRANPGPVSGAQGA